MMTIPIKTKEILLNIISEIEIPEIFPTIEEPEEGNTLLENLQMAINKYEGGNWEWRTGATKLVIVFFDLNIVIKIPFNGSYSTEELDNCELESMKSNDPRCCSCCCNCEYYVENEETHFLPFRGAGESGNTWNYCEVERQYYNEAVTSGFGDFFAFTDFLGETANNYPVYIQELCPTTAWEVKEEPLPKSYADSIKHATELYKKHNTDFIACFDEQWAVIAIEKYGKKLFDKFMLKFQKQNKRIFVDMHKNNYGYRPDGSPVIFDFSGYWEIL